MAPPTPWRGQWLIVALPLLAAAALALAARQPLGELPEAASPTVPPHQLLTVSDRAPIGDALRPPVRDTEGRWWTIRHSFIGGTLVRSDDALRWHEVESGPAPGSLLAAAEDDGVITVWAREGTPGGYQMVQFQREGDGRWARLDTTTAVGQGSWPVAIHVGEATIVTVDAVASNADTDRAGLRSLIERYASPDLAAATCWVDPVPDIANTIELMSCDGETVGRIGDPEPAKGRALTTMPFLVQSLQVIRMQRAGSDVVDELTLRPGERVLSLVARNDRVHGLIVDSLSAIEPESFSLREPGTTILTWSADGIEREAGPTPAHSSMTLATTPLSVSADGTMTLISPFGMFSRRDDEPWERIASLPFGSNALGVGFDLDGEVALATASAGESWVRDGTDQWAQLDLEPEDVVRQVVAVVDGEPVIRVDSRGFIGELRRYGGPISPES